MTFKEVADKYGFTVAKITLYLDGKPVMELEPISLEYKEDETNGRTMQCLKEQI